MRPLCKLLSETGGYTILPYLFNLWDRSKRKRGTRLERALDARNWIVGSRCPRESLVTMLDHTREHRVAKIPRSPFYEDEFMEGKYLHLRRYFLFPESRKTGGLSRATSLLYVVETTRACIFLNMLIYTITYSSCFLLLPLPLPLLSLFFFFLFHAENEGRNWSLPIISNNFY